MIRRSLIVAVLALLVAAPVAVAGQPPSFALWNAKWKAKHDPAIDDLGDKCMALYGKTANRKIGECFVKGARPLLRAEAPLWEREVAKVSVGQSSACKAAIHGYWLAVRKTTAATLIYLDSHPHTSMTDVASDLSGDPYATLKSVSDAAKSRAIRVCG